MAILVDDALLTAAIRMPLVEKWIETDIPFEVRTGLRAADVGAGDVALIASPESTLLAATHIVASEVAVVVEGISPIVMRTPVRPDEIEATPIRLLNVSGPAEMLIRALLKPFYGITASSAQFITADDDPNAAKAQVVVIEGLEALQAPESGFQSDLAQAWYILTGSYFVSHVVVVGLEAQARGLADPAIAILKAAAAMGVERRREVRGLIVGASDGEDVEGDAGGSAVDRDKLAEMTNNLSYTLDADDQRSLLNMIARGSWGSRYPQRNPVFRDDLPPVVRDGEVKA
ncbi:MAG: MqnA/MqnD/SBP family protein [Thermomicrobiales bacterium]